MWTPYCSPLPPPRLSAPLPRCFSLLVWNVHKLPFSTLSHCVPLNHSDILLLQEAHIPANRQDVPLYPWVMSPNLRKKHGHMGVLSASRYAFKPLHQYLTHHQERWRTRKSALLTAHPLHTGAILWVLNIHMLLTVSRRALHTEFQRLDLLLQQHDGPLIVAGDFNTWSRTRLMLWRRWARHHHLHWPTPENAHLIKAHRNRPLDHLLYRGLRLMQLTAQASDCSDHNPLLAQFCYD